jgi:tRNA-specific 2-thiouridylase
MNIRPSTGFSSPFPSFGPKSVAVLMSGGVDSSVTAWLLRKSGWHVVGVTMNIPGTGSSPGSCCGRDAASVALGLGIPHYTAFVEKEFEEIVVDPFVENYLRGRTPNPCADCNAFLKFGLLWKALEDAFGEVRIATGHYARIEREGNSFFLARGKNPVKDQSYFLYGIAAHRLPRLLLPLGGFSKEEVRALAREARLPVAEKRESMEICFAGEGDYRRLLEGRSLPSGLIVDEDGEPLGTHPGIAHYTTGQRKGLGIASREGLYVLRIDPGRNLVVVGPRERAFRRRVCACDVNILAPRLFGQGKRFFGKTRSRGEPLPCELLLGNGERIEALFDQPQFAPTPGQRLVLYDADGRVVAGGVIEYSEEAE